VRSEGMGLGLWIVKRTAQALGIVVQVHSVPGRGTHFSLRIPVLAAAETSGEPTIHII